MPSISNAALAIYISNTGEIIATERINGASRDIFANQLENLPEPSDATDILKIDVRVNLLKRATTEIKCQEYYAMRTCYDLSGRRVPCF